MDDALCREVGSEVFFPESNTNPRDAIEVCRRCDVEIECLNYALRLGPVAGVWGGTTEADRRRMRRRRAA
jgi:WhiB family redox-sensing transcriptional regulator